MESVVTLFHFTIWKLLSLLVWLSLHLLCSYLFAILQVCLFS